jgi:serine/threonine protein kinase/tetratricopeptide (TPR) repeat protein
MNGASPVPNTLFAGRFTIDREIGRGATAIVFLARDAQRGGEPVALKVLRSELVESSVAANFIREVRRQSLLDDERIVPVLDTGDQDGQHYIVLPYMEGGSLRELLNREKQLPIREAVAIASTIAAALEHAHQARMIHRDVKPENILFSKGKAFLADFGIARAFEKALSDSTTSTGLVRGTAAYMSPEQASGARDFDGRSDVYSLGCVLYEMLAGVPAFIGPTQEAIVAQRFSHPPRDIIVYRPTLPAALETIVRKALAFSVADRFRSAGEMAEALAAAPLDDGPPRVSTEQSAVDGRIATRTRRRTFASIGITLATIVGVALAWPVMGPTNPFRERDWILVADFEGPPDDPGLATALRELATAELNQSRFLNTLPRSQLNATMRLAGIPETTRVSPQLARELAVRSSVRAVLVGSIQKVGTGSYALVLQATTADDGANIVTASDPASDSTLIPTVQRLAREIRSGLGEHRGTIQATLPLEQVATPSFAAYRKYLEGMSLQSRGNGVASNRIMREALALDTGFASAWYGMAWNFQNERMLDSSRWAFQQALSRRARLSETQRYRLEADAAYAIAYDIPAAIRAYDLYLSAIPRSWVGHNNRGNYLVALGRYDEALESFTRAVASHPFGPAQAQIQVMNQAATLIALERLTDADRAARDLSGPFAAYIALMRGAASGAWTTIDSAAQAAATAPSSPGWLRVQATAIAAGALADKGALRAADDLLAQASTAASPDVSRWYHRARLLLGTVSGRALPVPTSQIATDATAPGLVTAGLSAAMRGDAATARRCLTRLEAFPALDQRRLGNGRLLVEAWIKANAGEWRASADLVGSAARAGEHDAAILDRVGSLSLRWMAAESYARTGQLDSAVATLENAIRPRHMPGNEFAQLGLVTRFAHRRLAQWYSSAGKPDKAAAHWRAFLQGLDSPDKELSAFIDEARRALKS